MESFLGDPCPDHVFQKEISINAAQTDEYGRIMPVALIRQLQAVAVEHLAQYGVTMDAMHAQGMLWVLVKTELWVTRLPRKGENVIIRVWLGEEKFWMYPERYVCYSASGEELVRASSLWIGVDKHTRRLAPPNVLTQRLPKACLCDEPESPQKRVSFPRELPCLKERVVQLNEIDLNDHMNNSCYIDWAMDLVNGEYLQTHTIKSFWVEYEKELRLGQRVSLRYTQDADTLFLKGYVLDEAVFSLKMEYRPSDLFAT